ncbi:MAG TPA: hypothetical protein VG389_26505 [Myxococcota bacterium]|jgi:hypothetical protein|nr:hypothetical protein [Myxococcota bacterium]
MATSKKTWFAALAAASAAGCVNLPTEVSISSPADGSTAVAGLDGTLEIGLSAMAWRYEPPGTCPPHEKQCGQAWINIDGDACNAGGVSYNVAGPTPETDNGFGWIPGLTANLTLCPTFLGEHTITVTLVRDEDGSVAATASVTVTVDAPPVLLLSDVAAGDTLTLGADADQTVDVAFDVGNFTLTAAGTCAGAARCGHVELRIDGFTCDEPGATFNVEGTTSPLPAHFARCAAPAGIHEIEIALHDDTHTWIPGDFTVATAIVTTQ